MTAPALIVVGTSLGGLQALQILLAGLPADFAPAMIIVQHRGREADDMLSKILQRACALPVSEPEDKEAIVGGRVYVAPADYHVLVTPGQIELSTEELVHHARPSIDVLFETAAEAYGPAVVGVVLTGSNHDGARGAARVKGHGGRIVVQDPATAESRAMPQAALTATQPAPDAVLPIDAIAAWLARLGG